MLKLFDDLKNSCHSTVTICHDFQEKWFPVSNISSVITDICLGVFAGGGLFGMGYMQYTYLNKKNFQKNTTTKAPQRVNVVKKITNTSRVNSLSAFLIQSIIAPVSEEILFRGYLKEYSDTCLLSKSETANQLVSMTTNSALFSLAHWNLKKGVVGNLRSMPLYFAGGCLFWCLAEKTEKLWAPTVGHITMNALTFLPVKRLNFKKSH